MKDNPVKDNPVKEASTRLLRYFLAGVFALLPLVVTIAVVIWVARFLQTFVGPGTAVGRVVARLGLQFNENQTLAYVFGWIFVLGIVFLFGVVVEMGARRFLQTILDGIVSRLPLIGSIYNTSKQLVSMLDKKDQANLEGMSVVFCRFGAETGAGVLALLVSPEKYQIGDLKYQIVMIPTAPVPFGGALLFVPAAAIVPAEMSVDGLMSIYVSMGVTAPQFIHNKDGRGQATSEERHP